MASLGTKEWIQFFTDSGIPSGIAASYALTFSNNRIRMDMLLDLNKEYLKEMGITLMGDVISILRHAKQVHEQNARDKILGSSTNSSSAPTPPSPKSTPASRMLDHYMRKSDQGDERDEPSPQLKSPSSTTVRTKKQIVKTKLEGESSAAPPAKKVRRVLPEHEGSYKITMPSGTTPRSQKILAKQVLLLQQKKKKTVFDRLGDGSVSSTTETESPSITITGPGLSIVKLATSPQEKQSSVFSRLGEKPQVSSTSNTDTEDDKSYMETVPVGRESSLPYAGVFKQDARKKMEIKRVKVATMQADIESAHKIIKKDGRVLTKSVQLQERLGAHAPEKKMIKTNKSTAGILGNPTNAKKLSVKARLGSSDQPVSSTDLVILIKRTGQSEGTITRQVTSPTPVKSVTFGVVTKKTFLPREAVSSVRNSNPPVFLKPINKNLNILRLQKRPKSGVFSRLGS
ncbi:hypothetical protein C0J52_00380 [Blattella germanica]|nr:hypothetical protein C0J52_00380 [Blattella germanica]